MIHPETGAIRFGPDGEECTIYPAVRLALGETYSIEGREIQRFSDHYACTCPAWRFHTERDMRLRSCAHLSNVLGDAYESARMTLKWLPETPSKRRGSVHHARQRLDQYFSPESPSPSKKRRSSVPSTPSKSSGNHDLLLPNAPEEIFITAEGEKRVVGRRDERVLLLLASTWPERTRPAYQSASSAIDPTGWWVSEKLDGVRAFWDGVHLWSRRGKEWNAPQWFLDGLPSDLPLDGELWIGRGLFEYTSGVCRSNRQSEWEQVKYMVFDTPAFPHEAVEARWNRVRAKIPTVSSADMQALRVRAPTHAVFWRLFCGTCAVYWTNTLGRIVTTCAGVRRRRVRGALRQGHAPTSSIYVRVPKKHYPLQT